MSGYRIIEKASRITAVDINDVEICGARQPYGHDYWQLHITVRVSDKPHHVLATSREAAAAHVHLIASLFVAAHQREAVA